MKNFITTLAFSCYLVFAIGLTINLHFCHGELSEISIAWQENHCGCDDMEGDMECCQNEEMYYRLNTDHLILKQVELQKVLSTVPFRPVLLQLTEPSDPKEALNINLPDPIPSDPVYLICHSLLFYG